MASTTSIAAMPILMRGRTGAASLFFETSVSACGRMSGDSLPSFARSGLQAHSRQRASNCRTRNLVAVAIQIVEVSGRVRRAHGRLVEGGGEIAHADDAGEAVIVDHGQMPNVMPVHQ